MSSFAQLLNGMNKHGCDCADLAFSELKTVDFDPAAVEITVAAAHQQISDDVHHYGAGKVKPKMLRVLTTKAQQAYDRRFAELMAGTGGRDDSSARR